MASSSKGSKKKRWRSQVIVGGEERTIDRLSDLPDGVLHHILSFLDTKCAVRTSLVSKRWRFLWRDVPALNFSRSVCKRTAFAEYIRNLLSLRSNDAPVASITFNFVYSWMVQPDMHLFDRIMKYAADSRRNGGHGLDHLSIAHAVCEIRFGMLAASIAAHHRESIKTLKVTKSDLDSGSGFGLGFSFLTALELRGCWLYTGREKLPVDPFAGLPCLNYLKLFNCSATSLVFKITGPQLLDFQIQKESHTSEKIEVFAPKLKSFRYSGFITELVKLSAPSLDWADIRIWWDPMKIEELELHCKYMKLLGELHNAKSLCLRFADIYDKSGPPKSREEQLSRLTSTPKIWEEDEFPLTSMKSLMESEASPFTRLKTLRVQYPQAPPKTPCEVINYFFERSPHRVGGKSVKFEKRKQMMKQRWLYV
ncbi:unnamed protein product [Linum trigynum]|uniref:F-box domain-containing protein n=1 Tax=Linum trigynum TaxID=586398 RepID=A0AAV2CA02_9ROSI